MKTFCAYYNQGFCKSCDLLEQDYPEQIRWKEVKLQEALADLNYPPFLPTEESPPQAFRNKAKLTVSGTLGNPVIGILGNELLSCPLHVPAINQLLPELKDFISLASLTPYHIEGRTGELKGLIIFHSSDSHETYLRFVLRSKESVDRIRKHHGLLLEKFPHLKCITVNIQPVPHAILEGEEEIFITDKNSILHRMGEITFLLGPRAFVQTNQKVATKLYQTAAHWIKDSGLKTFMELYCGQGAFSFFAAPHISQGLGVEINEEAVKVANATALKFQKPHLRFQSADAGVVGKVVEEFKPDIILVNPPRRGLAEAIKVLTQNLPQMIVYSSCNHETLCLDLKKLENNYEIRKIQIFDMFPNSSHFETLVELRLKTI